MLVSYQYPFCYPMYHRIPTANVYLVVSAVRMVPGTIRKFWLLLESKNGDMMLFEYIIGILMKSSYSLKTGIVKKQNQMDMF